MTKMAKNADTAAGATTAGATTGTTTGTTATEGTAMAPGSQNTVHQPRGGDWVIAGVMLAFFVAAFLLAQEWPFRAALFPDIITAAGALLSLAKLVGLTLQAVRARRSPAGAAVVPSERAADLPVQPQNSSPESVNVRTAAVAAEEKRTEGSAAVDPHPDDVQIVDDEQEEDESMEYVFASAGGRAWIAALGWVTTFFVSFFVLGAYITVPLFAFVYLMVAGKVKWWAALIYAVVTGLIIFVVFRDIVFIPLPESPFPGLGF
jgi:hypothetical protein